MLRLLSLHRALLRRQQVFLTTQRLFRLYQIFEQYDAALAARKLDFDRRRAYPLDAASISASHSRFRSRLRWVTELLPHPFEFQREVQRLLVLYGPLLVAMAKARVDETQVKTRCLRIFDWRAGCVTQER